MKPFIADHPLIQHKLTYVRNKDTGSKEFRELISEIAMLLLYEATRDLPLQEVQVETPLTTATTKVLAGRKLAFVPILRAGLGMVGGIWKLLDEKRDAFDPRAFLAPIMDTVMSGTGDEGAVALITDAMRRGVKEAVGTLIVEFGSYGKAPLVEPATLEDMAARYAKEG